MTLYILTLYFYFPIRYKRTMSQDLLQRLVKFNSADMVLYQYFVRRLAQRVRDYGIDRMENEVSKLKNRTRLWYKICVQKQDFQSRIVNSKRYYVNRMVIWPTWRRTRWTRRVTISRRMSQCSQKSCCTGRGLCTLRKNRTDPGTGTGCTGGGSMAVIYTDALQIIQGEICSGAMM